MLCNTSSPNLSNLDQQRPTSLSCYMSTAGQQQPHSPDHLNSGSWNSPHLQRCQSLLKEQELAEDLASGLNWASWSELYSHFIGQNQSCGPTTGKGTRGTVLKCAQQGCSEHLRTFENSIEDYNRAHVWVLQKIQHGLILWKRKSDQCPTPHIIGSSSMASCLWPPLFTGRLAGWEIGKTAEAQLLFFKENYWGEIH